MAKYKERENTPEHQTYSERNASQVVEENAEDCEPAEPINDLQNNTQHTSLTEFSTDSLFDTTFFSKFLNYKFILVNM
ncbi:hypothetical protein CEXT_345541 [Caerostris extrusa]|uniref:Uncharacterized protein n=1 Tax=Caerostris extrusa TaxID=172846 RepID=A0AAV4QNY4_CAEEX|nr:hypothetical protein CEXT_345541 [Caerostris extrusa]